ncbi:efflux RND transporter periplasmic adaptor subunit [Uliginosibacterium sp. H3]|uniref:Efflux RND transporter periplasmic adaptor subunit n=1 Tax=Uliginosibacterium silvisoli TaxID=3114758 RepID=A0ABU6K8D0_9RHOO|nr:efflux RND transporter periplasmic adaptor subunit [Uliginosibacterium sp. H3]
MTNKNPDIHTILNPGTGKSRRRWLRWAVIALVLLAVLAGAVLIWASRSSEAPKFRTAAVTRGDLASTVTATGTLQPRTKVDISSELSGTIAEVLADYNSKVKKGEPLAILNTSKLQDQMAQTRANIQNLRAKVLQARADVEQARAALERLEKVAQLSNGQLPAGSELDDARIKLKNTQAALAAGEASVTQFSAALHINETDLTKATIRSPIDGTVLVRSVDPGQTVAASLSAPVLFTIAQDLKQMDLNVAVAEADVGQVHDGMPATFTVDAWPGKKFKAKVRQVRYGSKTVDNVVSYETILQVNNEELTLRPGMTASADLEVAERNGVLYVPNAALRFTPPQDASGAAGNKSILSSLFPAPPNLRNARGKEVTQVGRKASGAPGRIWVLEEGKPVAKIVTVGLSDGRNTEISGTGVTEGLQVIIRAENGAGKGGARAGQSSSAPR